MQQWRLNPITAVGHATSEDLLHWTRLKDALSPGPSGDQECYDGSASILRRRGVLTPMLMIDGGCGLRNASTGSLPCMESSGNGSTGGILAFPADLSDPQLTEWTKEGPTVFHGCDGSSGPSPIWHNGDAYELLAIHGGGEARFVATDDDLKSWKMADPAFIAVRGGGGGLWRELPPSVDGDAGARWATHIFQSNGECGDGCAAFVLGVYDMQAEEFRNVTAPRFIDVGDTVRYGQLSTAGGTGNGGEAGDRRVVHISWLIGVQPEDPKDCETGGQLTSLRELRFDSRLGPLGALVETPIAEYEKLRGRLLFDVRHLQLFSGDGAAPLASLGAAAASMDVELRVALPAVGAAAVRLGLRCEARASCAAGAQLWLEIGAMGAGRSGGRAVGMRIQTPHETQQTSFELLGDEPALPLRVMLDLASVELFAASGRGVFSGALAGAGGAGWFTASCNGTDVEVSGRGWELKSIFPSEPTIWV